MNKNVNKLINFFNFYKITPQVESINSSVFLDFSFSEFDLSILYDTNQNIFYISKTTSNSPLNHFGGGGFDISFKNYSSQLEQYFINELSLVANPTYKIRNKKLTKKKHSSSTLVTVKSLSNHTILY